jgi:flavorubredoxin
VFWQWTKERLKQAEDATIAVIYASAYGNTAALAQAIRYMLYSRQKLFIKGEM